MKTLIIPCAGGKKINGIPSYLLRHPDGKLLITKCAESAQMDRQDNIVVAILKEDDEKYQAADTIYNELKDQLNIDVVVLNEANGGAAETVYKTIQTKKIVGEIAIKDTNNFLKTPTFNHRNYIVGMNLMKHKCDIHKLRKKSFLRVNENGQVLDIIEKHILSEYICVGLYGVSNARDFVDAYLRMTDNSYPVDKIYISHVITYLMGYNNKIFHYVEADYVEDWSEEKTWMQVQDRYALYFINMDTLFKDMLNDIKENNMEKLRILSKNGACFIGFTSGSIDRADYVQNILRQNEVNCLRVVGDCPFSLVKKIMETQKDIDRYFYAI